MLVMVRELCMMWLSIENKGDCHILQWLNSRPCTESHIVLSKDLFMLLSVLIIIIAGLFVVFPTRVHLVYPQYYYISNSFSGKYKVTSYFILTCSNRIMTSIFGLFVM